MGKETERDRAPICRFTSQISRPEPKPGVGNAIKVFIVYQGLHHQDDIAWNQGLEAEVKPTVMWDAGIFTDKLNVHIPFLRFS